MYSQHKDNFLPLSSFIYLKGKRIGRKINLAALREYMTENQITEYKQPSYLCADVLIHVSIYTIQECELRHGFKKHQRGTSLVAQRLIILLPMQETRIRALVREDPTCHRATKPMRQNY